MADQVRIKDIAREQEFQLVQSIVYFRRGEVKAEAKIDTKIASELNYKPNVALNYLKNHSVINIHL